MKHIISIDASPKQLSKLRNGHKVRIKQGTGFNVIVHPDTFRLASKAFSKGKGAEIQLSAKELSSNMGHDEEDEYDYDEPIVTPESHALLSETQGAIGKGIFGKKFDKALEKRGLKKAAYALGRELKPYAKAGITGALTAGGTALGALQPELIPFIAPGVAGLNSLAYSYLDNPDSYQKGFKTAKSGIKGKPVRSIAEQAVKAQLNQRMNEQLGTNYDYMSRAGLQKAGADKMSQELSDYAIRSRMMGLGIHDSGMHLVKRGVSAARGGRLEQTVSGRATVIQQQPALMSQPLGVNYQMSVMLPPQYQRHTIGSGLYAGGARGSGLYA